MNSIADLSGVACAVRASVLLTALLVAPFSGASLAQDAWPARPVRVVVPSSPGGGTDIYARLIAAGRKQGAESANCGSGTRTDIHV